MLNANYQARNPALHAPPWPEPKRPTPVVIIQSSATTGVPKLFRFSLYYYTINLASKCRNFLMAHPRGSKPKIPLTHPRLLLTPPHWQGFYFPLFLHLATATPIAFVNIPHFTGFSFDHLFAWAEGLDIGAISCSAAVLRAIPTSVLETCVSFLQSLYAVAVSGSTLGDKKSALFEKHKIPIQVNGSPSPPFSSYLMLRTIECIWNV